MQHSYRLGRERAVVWASALLVAATLALLLPSFASGVDTHLVTGTVIGADTLAPISGVDVQTYWFDGSGYQYAESVSTGADGVYNVYGAASHGAGTYRFVFAIQGRVSQTHDVYWDGLEPLTLDVSLVYAELIAHGTVTKAATGEFYPGTHIQAYRLDGASYLWAGEAYAALDGTYALFESEAQGPGDYEFHVNAAGYWLQAVRAPWNGVSPLSLSFALAAIGPDAYESDDTPEDAKPIAVDSPGQDRSVYPLGDHDWVAFQAIGGRTYVIETAPNAGSRTDTYLYLYGSDGTTAEDDDSGDSDFSRIVWTAGVDQTVFLMVRHSSDGAAYGSYLLSVTRVPNTPPTATDDAYAATSGALLTVSAAQGILANDEDADGGTLFPEVVSGAGHGTLVLADDGSFTYKSSPGFVGEDTFTYVVYDGESQSGAAIVTITVAAPPDTTPPTITVSGVANGGTYTAPVTPTFSATDPNLSSVTAKLDGATFVSGTTITQNGPHTLVVTATDSRSNQSTKTVSFTLARPALPVYTTYRGSDRYQTAALISKAAYPTGAPVVFLVKGDDFPDALAAGPLAAAYGGPIMITPSTGLNDTVRQELKRLAPAEVFVIGLPSTLNAQVKAALPGLKDQDIHEIRGLNRYHTATLIAEALEAKLGSVDRVVLVAGDNFPDALSAGPLAAKQGWAILLTPQKGPLPDATRQTILDLGVKTALRVGTRVALPSGTAATDLVGTDRYHTSALVAAFGTGFGLTFEHIALVKGDNYPDALVVGPYLEGASGTILLTAQSALPSRIVAVLEANIDTVRRCDIVGLPAAIRTEMETRFPPQVQ
jgi:putative cell wall-binding protein/5-hydroxyisourate hydrolase-like protein (transthyretin family)